MSKSYEDIELDACSWIARLDSEEMSDRDLRQLKRWLERDEMHRRVFEHFVADFSAVNDLLSTVGEAVRDLEKNTKSRVNVLGLVDVGRTTLTGFGGSVVAVVIMCAAFFFSTEQGGVPAHLKHAPIVYTSNIGQLETVNLPDGSVVTLNTDTELSVEFTDYERRVQLIKGEAVFDVEKDSHRPFRVHTNRTVVQAIGTVFSVKSVRGTVEVLVEEGVVELTANTVSEKPHNSLVKVAETRRVEQGGYTVFQNDSASLVEIVDQGHVERRMAWRSGMLVFLNEPLSDVVKEFNRYTETSLVVEGEALKLHPVSGHFPIGEVGMFLNALEQGFGVTVEHDQINNKIILGEE